jgi:hypothetical protein
MQHAPHDAISTAGYGPPPGPPPGGYGPPPGYGGPPGAPPGAPPPPGGFPPPGGYGMPPPPPHGMGMPQYPGGPMQSGPEPNVWLPLVLSIACIFCCWPLGIVGIILSIIAITKKSSGDWEGARTLSKIATIGASIVAALGLVFFIIYFILMAVGSIR